MENRNKLFQPCGFFSVIQSTGSKNLLRFLLKVPIPGSNLFGLWGGIGEGIFYYGKFGVDS